MRDSKEKDRIWRLKNKTYIRAWQKEWVRKRILNDPDYQKKRWQQNKGRYIIRLHEYRAENLRFLCYIKGMDFPKCEQCGYNKCFAALDGHHLNPLQKEKRDDRLSKWIKYPPKKFQEKIKRVDMILLCRNCHAELHAS